MGFRDMGMAFRPFLELYRVICQETLSSLSTGKYPQTYVTANPDSIVSQSRGTVLRKQLAKR
ncbi:predicted protein [Botrytis cinerea T4]|uniref:Uncharacterized protein n=1 Tax=Botryotinia fuckeliana (strain T4) TaxID=999810 RepID=G2XU45_BOTF4|nr:predicted protein [Botrytis cinerea T4]